MNTSVLKSNAFVVALFSILLLVALRLVPHWPNWTPILAFAGFSGYSMRDWRSALALTFVAMLISDAVLGFHAGMIAVYGTLALICIFSAQFLKRENIYIRGLSITTLGSIAFFLITNLFVWIQDGIYPQTIEGLWMCYVAALPFLGGTIASTAISIVLFESAKKLAEKVKVSDGVLRSR